MALLSRAKAWYLLAVPSLAAASCLSPPLTAPVEKATQTETEAAPKSPESSDQHYPFEDPELPTEERIDALIARLTLDEKIGLLSTDPRVPRLGVKGSGHVEGLHGLALGGPGRWGGREPISTTTFPQAIGLGETWDPQVVREAAAVEGYEARWAFHVKHRGGIVIRAPNADLARDPRWGRTEESYGEDPYHASTMAVAFVRGLQGEHERYFQAASLLKHFVANTNENGRAQTSSDFDERLFNEYYAVAFRAAIIEAGSRAFMAAYNAHNGVPCTTHPMLKDIALLRWGQNGIICTDAGALRNLVFEHKQFDNLAKAAAAAIKAGISQFLDRYRPAVRQALDQRLLSEADLDRAIRKNFRVMIQLGLLDPPSLVPFAQVDAEKEPWQSEKHRQLARLVTQKSVVLLKNSRGLLPLDAEKLESVAVIGPHADTVHLDWYSGTPPYRISPLEGIRQRLGDKVKVEFTTGSNEAVALKAAQEAEVVILVVGNHPTGDAGWAKVARPSYGKEGVDRQSISLEDEELVREVYKVNKNVVVVLLSSFPYAINWTQQNVPAILHMTHSSQELGTALADVLFGDYNPAGRVVQTWPRSMDDLPPMLDYDIRKGRTYQYFKGRPLYPFGYGLSYTSFAYSNLRVSPESLKSNGSLEVSVDVKNTGPRAGEEVVQLYVRWPDSALERPQQELKGFSRVAIKGGRTKTVKLTLSARQLRHWAPSKRAFTLETGKLELRVGKSSQQIQVKKTLMITD